MVIFLVNAAGFFETFTSYWLCTLGTELWGCNTDGPKVSGEHQGTWHSRLLKHAIKYWFSKQLQVLQFDFRDTVMINLGRDFNHTWNKCILPNICKYKPVLYLLQLSLAVVVVKLELMFSNSKLLSPQFVWGSGEGWYSERKTWGSLGTWSSAVNWFWKRSDITGAPHSRKKFCSTFLTENWFRSNILNKKKAFQVLNPTESSDVIQGSIWVSIWKYF